MASEKALCRRGLEFLSLNPALGRGGLQCGITSELVRGRQQSVETGFVLFQVYLPLE